MASVVCPTAQSAFEDWPEGKSPEEIGALLGELFVNSPHGVYNSDAFVEHIPYFEVCTWYGALSFAAVSGDESLQSDLVSRFELLMEEEDHLIPPMTHVDYNVFGVLPLEVYLQEGERQYLQLGIDFADSQFERPPAGVTDDEQLAYLNTGLSWQTRLWIDDMYMISAVQAQAYRATDDGHFVENAARQMAFYLDSLQQPNGLFYHGVGSNFFWGRGNGWMAAGMTELLRVLPDEDPHYDRILAAYQTMMGTLLDHQSESGMWRQLVDDKKSWVESSSTAMYSYAMITGVKSGWLPKENYAKAARKAWLALVTDHINENGEVTDVCEGTGKGDNRQYYLDRKRNTGDYHGQAPVLWCAAAFLR